MTTTLRTATEVYALKREMEEFQNRVYSPDHGGVATEELTRLEVMRERIEREEKLLGGKVFRVPTSNLGELEKRIAKIAKRSDKLGLPPVTLTDTGENEMVKRRTLKPEYQSLAEGGHMWGPFVGDEFWDSYFVEYRYVVLAGETPRVAGYEFVATLEHEEAGTIIRRVPRFEGGEIDLSAFRNSTPERCDHCRWVRNRKDTYVVYGAETGDLKQVGRTCLRDFTGANNPEQFARMAEWLRDLFEDLDAWDDDEESGGGGRGERFYSLSEFLAQTARVIREFGWTSRGKAREEGGDATADIAWDKMLERKAKFQLPPEDQDIALTEQVIEWLRSDEFEEDMQRQMERNPDNDYLWNLHVSTQRDFVNERKAGIVASAVYAFQRRTEQLIRKELERETSAASEFVGVEGKRHDFVLTLTRIIWIEDRYNGGTKPLYTFVDPDGNAVKWFASNVAYFPEERDGSTWQTEIKEGETYKVKATVKRHEDHPEFGRSTLVTRAKVSGPVEILA